MALPTYSAASPSGDIADSPTIKHIQLPPGISLEYAEQGSPTGTPVIMLHGITDSWHSFERVLSYLPSSIHAFALSQRGHGDSDRPEGDYTIPRFSADVAEFMDAVGLSAAVLVGHSMGSLVAERFAIDHGERTTGLVLASATPSMVANSELTELAAALETVGDTIPYDFAREFQESTLAQPIPANFLETVIAECRKPPASVWRAANTGLLESDLSSELGAIRAPTVIVHGDQDTFMSRADHEAVRDAIPGSRLCIYEGAGHAMHWEEPSRFAADLVAFVERVNAKARAS
jgi:non-heme chloroperoxidase